MRLSRLLGFALLVVVTGGQQPEATGPIQQYQLQDGQGSYKFGFKTADQMAEAEGDRNSEVKGKYAYVDKNGDMLGVEYTAGVNGFLPKVLNKQEAEASILIQPTIVQPNTEDEVPTSDHLKNTRYQNRPPALHYNTRTEIEQMDEAEEETKISASEKVAGKTNSKTDYDQSEAINPTEQDEEKIKSSKEEIVRGKYTFIEKDGIPATIEYEAGPEIGFVVKSFTKESLQSRLLEKGSDTVYDTDGLTVRKGNAPERSIYNEEGTEETYPEGFVRGLYTFTDEDGVSATIEYEAGPKVGFVVKKVSMGYGQEDQLEQGIDTSLNTNTDSVPSSIQQDSSEGESININVKSNENAFDTLTAEYSPPGSNLKDVTNQDNHRDNDSTQFASFTKDLSSLGDPRIRISEQEALVEQPDEDEEKEIPMNAAYRFGFAVQDQSRHERADTLGNVHGNYSYVDGAGLLTKVEYEAGAKKGFVIKRMTHEHTKATPQDKQHKQLNKQRENLHEEIMDDYDVSPYVSREYVDERNLPVRDEFITESESSGKDSTVASGSDKHFSIANPETLDFKSESSYVYNPPPINDYAVQQEHTFPKDVNTDSTSSSYSIFYRNPSEPDIPQDVPALRSYKYFSHSPYIEPIPDDIHHYQNLLHKVEPYRTEPQSGFTVYGPPLIDLPAAIISLDPENTRKADKYINRRKHHHKHKKVVKRPSNITNNQNFTTSPQPDGSYAFAYRTKDHSREQSIDQKGNVHYRYQIKTKRDGNTLVIFSNQVPQHLVTSNDDGMLSEDKAKEDFSGSNEYYTDHSVYKPYYLQGTVHPSNHQLSTQQYVSRNGYISPNRNQKLDKRGHFRNARSNTKTKTPSNNEEVSSPLSRNSTDSSRQDNSSSY